MKELFVCLVTISISLGILAQPSADLALIKTSVLNLPNTAVFTLKVTDKGPQEARNVIVSDIILPGLNFVSANYGATYDGGTRLVSWVLGTIAKDSSVTLTLTTTITIDGIYTNTASVQGSFPDPVMSNNTGTSTISLVTAIENTEGFTVEYKVYPNPTRGIITLTIKTLDKENIKVRLYDLNGILLQDKKVISEETEISIESLKPAIYLMKVLKDNKEIKEFKIIKK
jgi:uncharacterized repeat protein (TIGR01451 family)